MMAAPRARRARKRYWCNNCVSTIQPGDVYVVHTEFPGGELGYADMAGHPIRLTECRECAQQYNHGHLVAEREAKP